MCPRKLLDAWLYLDPCGAQKEESKCMPNLVACLIAWVGERRKREGWEACMGGVKRYVPKGAQL